MKRSEFEAARRAHWSAQIPASDQRVKYDVVAAEAAGVTWDPEEEEPLPERLMISPNGQYITNKSHSELFGVVGPRGTTRDGFADQERCREIISEALRRWNAWPELREEVRVLRNGGNLSIFLDAVAAIIDGKEV